MNSVRLIEDVQTHFRTCHICEASCGLEIQHRNGDILSIKGDVNDPLSQGYICPKGVAIQDIQNDPDRLRKPMKRTEHGWQEISWQQALDEVGDKIREIQWLHGNNAVGLYVGNPAAHNHGALLMLAPFIAALNTRSRFSATSCDQLPHMLACLQMFGHFANFPIPDIDRTQYFLCLGANPLVSNGSVMTAPNFKERLKQLQGRGGKCVVLDPRRTETALVADEHHFIKPGTDSLLLLALLHVVFDEQLDELGAAEGKIKNIVLLQQACMDYTPELASEHTGIDADTIRRLAREFASAESAAAYGRVGISTSMFSGLNAWLIYALNIVTGNLDKAGGLMFTLPAIDIVSLAAVAGETGSFNTWQSRVRTLPEFAGEMPVATMAEEILTPGDNQIRAMIVHSGNPVLSVPNGPLLERAFAQLDYVVSIDIYLNETSRLANIILPPTGPLEHGHYELALHAVAVRNTVKYSPPLLKPADDALHEWQILAELTARIETRNLVSGLAAQAKLKWINRLGDEGILDWLIRLGPYGQGFKSLYGAAHAMGKTRVTRRLRTSLQENALRLLSKYSLLHRAVQASAYGSVAKRNTRALDLDMLKQHPHGIDLGPLQPMLAHRVFTADGKIDLAPALFLADLPRLRMKIFASTGCSDFLLIGRRHLRSNNSWLHNSMRLVKGKTRCNLMMSPQDAMRLQLKDGDEVFVESGVGRVRLPLVVSDAMMPGVVSMPHGWGHHRPGIALDVATRNAGVSMNDVTDHRVVDDLTGMAVVNGVSVTVTAVNATQDQHDKRSTTA